MSFSPENQFYEDCETETSACSDRKALDELVERLYSNLKLLAARVRWRNANPSLNPTALVQEAWLKLLNSKNLTSKPHNEILSIFAHVMRQIMSDAARRKRSHKRGGNGIVALTARHENSIPQSQASVTPEDVLSLEAALDELRIMNERQADIMDRRYYLGLTAGETAAAMEISKTTVEREERIARKFLEERMRLKKH